MLTEMYKLFGAESLEFLGTEPRAFCTGFSCLLIGLFLRWDVIMYPWLTWDLLCRPGCLGTHRGPTASVSPVLQLKVRATVYPQALCKLSTSILSLSYSLVSVSEIMYYLKAEPHTHTQINNCKNITKYLALHNMRNVARLLFRKL